MPPYTYMVLRKDNSPFTRDINTCFFPYLHWHSSGFVTQHCSILHMHINIPGTLEDKRFLQNVYVNGSDYSCKH